MLEEVHIIGGAGVGFKSVQVFYCVNNFLGTLPLQEQKKESCQINLPLLKQLFRNATSPPPPRHWVDGNECVSVLRESHCRLSGLISPVFYLLLG